MKSIFKRLDHRLVALQVSTSPPSPTIRQADLQTSTLTAPQPNSVLILASGSPRRSELLTTLGVPFVVRPALVEEPRPEPGDELQPAAFVERLARYKAEHCIVEQSEIDSGAVVLAADTIVWLEGAILNKPEDADEARGMLRCLRGKTHTVYTGVCLRVNERYYIEHEATQVQFGQVSDEWIDAYVATGESLDKAGAYAVQGRGALLVARITGDFWNVVGLPLWRLGQMLAGIGRPVESWWN